MMIVRMLWSILATGTGRHVDQLSRLIDDDHRCLLGVRSATCCSPRRRPGSRFGRCGVAVFSRLALVARRAGVANQDRRNGEQLYMEESDGAVIADSLDSPGAFGVIFDRHGSTLLRFLARRVDPADAEDLLGEVFRIAFERRSTFDRDRDSARPWLYGIAANVVAKHHRSEARRLRAMARVSAGRLLDDDPAERAVAAADAGARWVRVMDAIGTLPEAERKVLLLFAWEELSYDEIALALGVPVGTVRSRLSRGRARLAALTRERDMTTDVPLPVRRWR
jgi:RNA polymerase sigma factor (sigma-70 family)